ncbi:hypothetical protein O181_046694 [Austropuccinia psidii MF-1]|uniref:Uncharacterized protein n=1 Tax=Austropuccinia psidii MF-1 TaxID=1389203 RepID=A0A9Q3HLG3_9BASI|nr:hypothetical protein [Austropuccinia psidii MF-1]
MAGTEIYDITRNDNGCKSVRAIEPPSTNCPTKGISCVESVTARSTRCKFCNLGKRNCSKANYSLSDNPRRLWRSIKKGGIFALEAPVNEPPPLMPPLVTPIVMTGSRIRGVQKWNNTSSSLANIGGAIHPKGNHIGVATEVTILVPRKDGKAGKLERNLVVQDKIDTNAEGSDEIDAKELEMTTLIQKRRIQSLSQSPFQASTTNHEVIRSPNHLNLQLDPQPGHPHLPLPLPVSNHLWPALPDTQCLQNLNQSLKPIAAGI